MKLSGADILINCLVEQGVDTIFGYPGGTVLDIYDALYRNGKINHVITSHEQGAAHAADGYARVSGKVGVCFATSGPGATNLVTGIATAYMDSIPMVAITGNVGMSLLGRDSFQEIDITGITIPITKHNFIVKDVNDLADTVREAFKIANSGRKGPVLIDILKNVQTAVCEYEEVQPENVVEKSVPVEKVADAVKIINESVRPLIMVGGGAISSNASEKIYEFAKKLNSPVVCTLMGLGAYPASDPLFCGMMGMHGTQTAAKLCLECDTIIAIGTRFSDRVALNRDQFAKNRKVVQFEIDVAEIDKNVGVDVAIRADVSEILKTMNPLLAPQNHDEWLNIMNYYKATEKGGSCSNAFAEKVLKQAHALAPEGTVIATDVGQHQMWTAQYYPVEKPRTICTSGGLGTMGYGFGAAIGAAFASGKHVIMVTGDGSFNMNLNELSTAVTQNLPITVLLMNNGALGMVRQWQKIFYDRRFSQTTVKKKTDYVKFAESFGAIGMRIESEEDIVPVLTKALNTPSPVIVDCRISIDDNVLPMIKPGQTYETIVTKM